MVRCVRSNALTLLWFHEQPNMNLEEPLKRRLTRQPLMIQTYKT